MDSAKPKANSGDRSNIDSRAERFHPHNSHDSTAIDVAG